MGTPAHDTLKGTDPEPSGASGVTTSEAGVADGVRVGVVVAEGVACAVCVPDADGVTLGDGVPERDDDAVPVPDDDGVTVTDDDGVEDGVLGGVAPVERVGDGEPVRDADAEDVSDAVEVPVAVVEGEGDVVCDPDAELLGVTDDVRVPVGVGVAHTMVLETPISVYGDGSRMYHACRLQLE